VFGTCSPEGLMNFTSNETVEDSVVHFLSWMLGEMESAGNDERERERERERV
jgi:hypothetical protein